MITVIIPLVPKKRLEQAGCPCAIPNGIPRPGRLSCIRNYLLVERLRGGCRAMANLIGFRQHGERSGRDARPVIGQHSDHGTMRRFSLAIRGRTGN